MADQSFLDKKYFIDKYVYNCPYCNRRNVRYSLESYTVFNWSNTKECYVYFIICSSCKKKSMHLSYKKLHENYRTPQRYFEEEKDLDSNIFYSVPTSFFILDERIPKIIRELITEAEGCLKMNFLTGASACMRKCIYELLIIEECVESNYDEQIKKLKIKYKDSDPVLFDILAHIKDMTSDKIHEQAWDKWDSDKLKLIIETLKAVLYDVYVIPLIRKESAQIVQQLHEKVKTDKNN